MQTPSEVTHTASLTQSSSYTLTELSSHLGHFLLGNNPFLKYSIVSMLLKHLKNTVNIQYCDLLQYINKIVFYFNIFSFILVMTKLNFQQPSRNSRNIS